ncbi:inorganic phosphate transporter [Oceanidesulfovibrio marinus]|uniref:Phosphate transporter n=1 Tax=Oceanidesulfovibrio marinus TaxID=370038 RepID=A0A6P1ZE00_9BACT|nr:inorganic phosphate transporter [Oceanidesulfovibrio marinus]QJT07698.1 inorganic phosphate transporter [Oceanidesulfovibrio marinus]TVM32056.1 phosphate permease [Oceanidesulfovibrio marinus]
MLFDIFLVLSIGAGLLMAFNLGANDVANSMASAVGARAITVKQAVYIAGILNFVGAVFLGSHVTATISKGIINPDIINDPTIIMLGMFAALVSASLWVLVATLTSLPVSSTHSIVGSILGFGLVAGGPGVVNWGTMISVVLSWIISPFFGGLIAYGVFTLIRSRILIRPNLIESSRRWAPRWIAFTMLLLMLSFMYKTPAGKSLHLPLPVSLAITLGVCAVAWLLGRIVINRLCDKMEDSVDGVECIFRRMQIGTSCYVAVSQGANDVANAIGPVAAIFMIAKHHQLLPKADVPIFLLVIGGAGIAMGIAIFGRRVIATVGERITTLTNTRGFAVDFGAATTVLAASSMGMPVSTTHAAVGSVVGVGLARGFAAVDFRVLGKIVLYWLLTVPIAAFTSIVIFQILRWTLT